jgi:hypothetical protein
MIPGWTVRNANDDVLTHFTPMHRPSKSRVRSRPHTTTPSAFVCLRHIASCLIGLRCRSWNARNCQIVRVVNARGARRTKPHLMGLFRDQARVCPDAVFQESVKAFRRRQILVARF